MELVCRAFKPPANIRAKAIKAWRTPHITFVLMSGFKSPFLDIIPRTKVAESADVMKKVQRRTTVTMEMMWPKGTCSMTMKKAVSVTWMASAAISGPREIPVAPNTANHKKDPRAGTIETPMINSRMVRPLEIRAINTPTNGAHAIHHAQ